MVPQLLALPAEIRHRILQHATYYEEFLVCNPRSRYSDYVYDHFKRNANPNASLWLTCKQIAADLGLIEISKPALRFCKLACARRYIHGNASFWKSRIKCVRVFYGTEELWVARGQGERDFRLLLEDTEVVLFGLGTTYRLEDVFEDPRGVVVTFYPRRMDPVPGS